MQNLTNNEVKVLVLVLYQKHCSQTVRTKRKTQFAAIIFCRSNGFFTINGDSLMPPCFVQAEVDAQKMSVSWRKRQTQIMEVENYRTQGSPTRDPENDSFENLYSEIDFCDSV